MRRLAGDFETDRIKYTRLKKPPQNVRGHGKDKIGDIPVDTFIRYENGHLDVFIRAYLAETGEVAWWLATQIKP